MQRGGRETPIRKRCLVGLQQYPVWVSRPQALRRPWANKMKYRPPVDVAYLG